MRVVSYDTFALSPTQGWAQGSDGSILYLLGQEPGVFTELIQLYHHPLGIRIVTRDLTKSAEGIEHIVSQDTAQMKSFKTLEPMSSSEQLEISKIIKKVFREYLMDKKYSRH